MLFSLNYLSHCLMLYQELILGNSDLLSFISIGVLLAKAFLIFVFCIVVKNNSWGNSSSKTFFLANINVVPVLFFAAYFILFSCVFTSLTLASSFLAIFYKTATLPWKNVSCVSFIFCKTLKQTWIH